MIGAEIVTKRRRREERKRRVTPSQWMVLLGFMVDSGVSSESRKDLVRTGDGTGCQHIPVNMSTKDHMSWVLHDVVISLLFLHDLQDISRDFVLTVRPSQSRFQGHDRRESHVLLGKSSMNMQR